MSEHSDVEYIRQRDFMADTKMVLDYLCREYTCFFVDDNIVYNLPNIYGDQIEYLLDNVEDAGCFSLRLGQNTVVQDPYTNKRLQLPNFIQVTDNILAWDWQAQPYNNFGYPFSVDGHIYQTDLIYKTISTYDFDTPNALEGRFPAKTIPRAMFCLHKSSVVNNPINLVGSSNNNAGKFYGYTLEELNKKYLDGWRIDLDKICTNNVVGCHQEMEIDFV